MSDQPSAVQKFMGGLLMAVGGLIAGLCGLCTLVFTATSLTQSGEFAGAGMLLIVLPLGGIPTGIGALIAWGGWRLIRPRPPTKPKTLAVFSDDPPP